ncbi:MAG: hypothetical protein AABZ74_05665 [Cyanobacteriota bacterium]
MSITKIILFFFTLIYFTLPSFAVEAINIKADLNGMVSLNKKGCTRSMVQKSFLASVKLVDDKVEINAKNIGSSYIYLWFGDRMEVYNLKVDMPKEVKIKSKSNILSQDSASSKGKYSVSASESVSDKDGFKINTKRDLIHNFNYDTPFADGNLSLGSVIKSNFANYAEINNLDIQNMTLKYSNSRFSLNAGNIYSSNPDEKSTLRGLDFNYNFNALNNIKFYTGLSGNQEIALYSKEKNSNLDDKNKFLSIGLSNNYNPFEWFQLSSSFNTNVYLNNFEKNYLANVSYKIKPTNNISLLGNVKSNFEKLSLSNNLYYKQEFFNANNFWENVVSQNYESEKIIEAKNINNNVSVMSKIKHESNTELISNYSYSSNKQDISNNFNIKLAKELQKNMWKVYGSYDIKNRNKETEKSYSLGSNANFKAFLPLNLSYSHIGILEKEKLNIENLDVNYRVFANEVFSLDLVDNLNYNFNLDNSAKNSFLNSVSLSSNTNFGDFSFGTSLGYSKQIEDKINLDKIFFKLDSSINITPFNQIVFQSTVNKVINGALDINSNISYNYTFGNTPQKKGKINGVVFDDENNNGVFEKNEKIFPKVELSINNKIITTNDSGEYEMSDLDFADYQITIKNNSLPKSYKPSISQENVSLDKANHKVDFILSNKVAVKGYIYANKNKTKGVAGVQLNVDNIQSLTSDEDGYFAVKSIPGLHVFQVDYNTIPKNYTMKTKATQKINVEEEKENTVEFILNPIRVIKGIIHKKNDLYSKVENVKIEVNHLLKDEVVKKEEVLSDEDGEFIISEFEGDSLEIKVIGGEQEILKFEIDENPFKKELQISMNN